MSFAVHFLKELVLEVFFHTVIIMVKLPSARVCYTCESHANMTTAV